MPVTETMVRMGEFVGSRSAGDVLVALGLGSCIGLALLDRIGGVAGLAHIMLPEAGDDGGPEGKYADRAVPALVERMMMLGARPRRLEAVLVGGAQMFSFGNGSGLDIGGRNERATREALERAGIPVRAASTSGSKGRTIKVYVESGLVTAKEAGGAEEQLLRAR